MTGRTAASGLAGERQQRAVNHSWNINFYRQHCHREQLLKIN
jgi:hypothetical protein